MSQYEHKPGTFSLFKSDKKGNEKRPDYRGDGKDMAGRDIEVAAWLREGKNGKFMSCTFKLKEAAPAKAAQPEGADDDHIPF